MKQSNVLQRHETREGHEVERASEKPLFTPAVDIYELNDRFLVLADMPGVDENHIDITLEKKTLTIYGRVENSLPEGYTLRHREYGVGDYQRAFSLTDEVDEAKIEASVKNGVLKLVLPKREPTSRKITVKTT